MKNIYVVLFRENKLIIKSKSEESTLEYNFTDIISYPNVPFYSNLFQSKIDTTVISKYIKNNLKDYKLNNLFIKPSVFVLTPDDVTEVDKRAIHEFILISFKPKMVLLGMESVFTAPIEEQNYVSIYRSCRMVVFTYIKNKDMEVQRFLHNKDYSIEEMKGFIYNLHEDCRYNKLNIYLNGQDLDKYYVLGKIVLKEELFQNAYSMLSMKKLL